MSQYLIVALYHFVSLPDFRELKVGLDRMCRARGINGTLLLAHEGVNGTIAGKEDDMRFVLAELRRDARLAGFKHKESWSVEPPFLRLKVRLKKEIVTLGVPGVDPTQRVGTYVKPEAWNALISQPDVLLIDTRNTYETKMGSFKGATDPKTESFQEFPQWLKDRTDLTPKTRVAMFCTGGIRCEKASSYMLQEGFEEVYHLEGGILKYLEEVPQDESMWEGDCYVFDRRVTVNHDLEPGRYDACRACGLPLDDEDKTSPLFVKGVACPYCDGHTSDERKERFAERQRQIDLAEARGQGHLGQRQRQHLPKDTE
jgi:UPF0176 protein